MNFLSESLMARIKEQVKDQLPQILPKEVSNFAPPVIEKLIKESRDEVILAKVSSQLHSTYEAASTLTEFELKKILLNKMEKKEKAKQRCKPTTGLKKKDSTSGSSKGTKSQPKSSGKSVQSEEPVFEVADSDMPQDQEGNMGDNEDEPRKETASRHDWIKKTTPPQEPTDLDRHVGKTTQEGPPQKWLMTLAASTPTDKPLLKGTRSNYAKLEYDFEECYKALSEKLDWENPKGDDYLFDLSKPLPLTTHGKRQRVPFEYFINNDLKFKEGDSLRLQINDIKDMLILVVQNRLTNLSGDDIADFAIALRMFNKSLVIQKRVENLQLGVESYQNKINVTNPNTTRPDLIIRNSYTPYKDTQGFIYFDDYKRNRLMRSDELYKFSDDTLTRLLSSLEDITKNVDMEYLTKRRWSTLEKKRAYFMIKDINKLLKERRMMRNLEKFVADRL
ncbi:hypothetical protein Tco_0604225 [Tanacetum coccineum]